MAAGSGLVVILLTAASVPGHTDGRSVDLMWTVTIKRKLLMGSLALFAIDLLLLTGWIVMTV